MDENIVLEGREEKNTTTNFVGKTTANAIDVFQRKRDMISDDFSNLTFLYSNCTSRHQNAAALVYT